MAVRNLVRVLREKIPGKRIVFSTITSTGNQIVQGFAGDNDFVLFLPFDLSFIVRKVIRRVNPRFFIIVETEIWPNLISSLYEKRIPIVVVNGRISDRSFRGYKIFKLFLGPLLNRVSLFCVQTENDRARLLFLGVSADKIRVTGNMKFDNPLIGGLASPDSCRSKLNLQSADRLFVAASTHSGEEEVILRAYKKLLIDCPSLKLLIAPRHPERTNEIEKVIIRYGFIPCRLIMPRNSPIPISKKNVFILNSVGQLLSYYYIADIVFVGGSLADRGGHNILEPACLGKPVLFGPHMFNFRDIVEIFLAQNAALLIHDADELEEKIRGLLKNPQMVEAITQRAKEIMNKNCGATQKNLEGILALYPQSEQD